MKVESTNTNKRARSTGKLRGRSRQSIAVIGIALAATGGGIAGVASAATTSTTLPVHAGPGGPGDPIRGPGNLATVTALSASSVTVSEGDGTSDIYSTTSSTVYEKDGTPVTASALSVGESVAIRSSSPNSSTASEIDIVSPSVSGTVLSMTTGRITIKDSQGFWRTINVSGSTTYSDGGQSATASAVTVGETVMAIGTIDTDHESLDATAVNVVLPMTPGTVKSISGSSIVITDRGGSTITVTTTASTSYRKGEAVASSSDIAVGSMILVEGTVSGDTVSATSIEIAPVGQVRQGPPRGGPAAMNGVAFGGPQS